MTKKQLLRVHLLFNDLVQKKVNDGLAWSFETRSIDYLGGIEVVLKSDCIVWLEEVMAIQVICNNLCIQSYIDFNNGQIILH